MAATGNAGQAGITGQSRVDGESLSARLQALPYAQLVALVDVVERFWAVEGEAGDRVIEAAAQVRHWEAST